MARIIIPGMSGSRKCMSGFIGWNISASSMPSIRWWVRHRQIPRLPACSERVVRNMDKPSPLFSFRMVRTSGLLRRRIQSRNVSHLIIIRIPICRASAAVTGWWADVRRIMVLSRWQRLVESSAFSRNRELRHSVMKMKSLILTTMLSA